MVMDPKIITTIKDLVHRIEDPDLRQQLHQLVTSWYKEGENLATVLRRLAK